MKALRWGILGTGNIARQFVAGIRDSQRGTLVAVGSRTSDRAKQFAETEYPAAKALSYSQVCENPEVDVIYVALPNSMHREWTITSLRAGKHVLCEKPIASNTDEATEMFQVAREVDRHLIEAFMYRSHPQTQAIVESVRRGDIGELRLIRTSFSFRTRQPDGNIRFSRQLAGGALMDVGCYCLDFSRWLAGSEPKHSHAVARIHASGIDEVTTGTLVFPNDVLASFSCGLGVQADNTAYICGTDGYLEIPVPWKPAARGAEFTVRCQPPPLADNLMNHGSQIVGNIHTVDAHKSLYALEVDDVAATILDNEPARLSAEDTLGNMRVLDELRRQIGVLDQAAER